MQRQKMLLPFQGKTIIERVISNVQPVLGENIMVVLGSHYYEIREQISKLQVRICRNKNFMEGMLSSVVCGITSIPEDAKAAVVVLGDQPRIPPEAVKEVINGYRFSGKGIIIPVCQGRRGHPVLIDMKYRKDIEELDPEQGLRQLMVRYREDLLEVAFEDTAILKDIDTPRDYKNENRKN